MDTKQVGEPIIDVLTEVPRLSNYYLEDITFRGLTYKSVAHAYEAFKFHLPEHGFVLLEFKIERILNAPTAKEAKAVAYEYSDDMVVRTNAEKVKLAYEIMEAKFRGNAELKQILIDTYPTVLFEEHNSKDPGDDFWGVDSDGIGENVMGNILMDIRQTLISENLSKSQL